MRIVRTLALVFVLSVIATTAQAAPVTITLSEVHTQTIQYIQIETGSMFLNGAKIGEYINVRTSPTVEATVLSGAATLTLLFDTNAVNPNPSKVMTLQGSYHRGTFSQIGSVSASSVSGLVGVKYSYDGPTKALTLQMP